MNSRACVPEAPLGRAQEGLEMWQFQAGQRQCGSYAVHVRLKLVTAVHMGPPRLTPIFLLCHVLPGPQLTLTEAQSKLETPGRSAGSPAQPQEPLGSSPRKKPSSCANKGTFRAERHTRGRQARKQKKASASNPHIPGEQARVSQGAFFASSAA